MVAGMQQRLDERGDQLAIVDEFGEWTWADFNDRVNWHFSAEEIAYVLENSGATVVVGDAEFAEAVTEAVAVAGTRVRISYGGPIDGFTDINRALQCAYAGQRMR